MPLHRNTKVLLKRKIKKQRKQGIEIKNKTKTSTGKYFIVVNSEAFDVGLLLYFTFQWIAMEFETDSHAF